MQNSKLFGLLIIIMILAGSLFISAGISVLMKSVIIKNNGQIAISGSNITAASGYWQDIQNAVNQVAAAGGGEVHIPAGTWNFVNAGETWSGTGGQPRVSVPAGVSIYGATNNRDANGQNTQWNTVLMLPSSVSGGWENDGISFFKITGSGIDSPFSRISDLKLVGYRSINSTDEEVYAGVFLSNVGEFRVDHVYFENIALSGVRVMGVYSRGVIDHCYFVNTAGRVGSTMDECTVFYGVYLVRGTGDYWDSNVQNVLGKYTDYTVFIENCYFEKWRHCTAGNSGAHYVLRYSIINNDFGYGSVDAHGWGVEATQVGTRAVELYNNQITNAFQYGWATFIRGGAGIAFNNTVGGGTYNSFLYFSNEASWSKCWTKDWWIWGNTLLPGTTLVVGDSSIREGYEYFLSAPTWGYTPYAYPHPLTIETP